MKRNILLYALILLSSTFILKAGKTEWRQKIIEMLQNQPSGPLPADAQYLITLAVEEIKLGAREERVLKGLQKNRPHQKPTIKTTSEGHLEDSSWGPPQKSQRERLKKLHIDSASACAVDDK